MKTFGSALNTISYYQRTIRTTVWCVLIVFAFISFVVGFFPQNDKGGLIETMLYAMFVDMGINSAAKSWEKVAESKANATSTTVARVEATAIPSPTTPPNPEDIEKPPVQ